MRLAYQPIDTPGTEMYQPSKGSPHTANTWGNLLSMRSTKQTERQQLLMESSLAYPRGREEKSNNSKRRQNSKGEQTLGYLGVVKPVTPEEDVPLRGNIY
ncbi:hypothetical protein AVEN_37324-1 [Araneus ventricosus]|uniref:Uncharacterized protein n=1 Tax=Araneus ventricosus TaxID=182803 RepID=A0A4Y2WG77_ARAVE|nr:hypothetical protein AVEN_37324-1 [Araneus ventricosus]